MFGMGEYVSVNFIGKITERRIEGNKVVYEVSSQNNGLLSIASGITEDHITPVEQELVNA